MKLFNNISLLLISISTAILLTACGTGHDHGPTPVGLNLLMSGDVIATQQGTTISYTGDTNYIAVTEGETSPPITVQFFLESGETYNYSTDDGYSLIVNIGNSDAVGYNHPVQGSQWDVELIGVSEGTSTLSFELFHVDHSDFESRNFEVRVAAASD